MTRSDFGSLGVGPTEENNAGGLKIAELLDRLPDSYKPLVRLMIRKPQGVTVADAVARLGQEVGVIQTMLDELVQQGYVGVIADAVELKYQILLARRQGSEIAVNLVQALAPGKPLSVIPNPSGTYTIRPGETFVLSVTVSNKGNQSALIDVFIDEAGAQNLVQWCGGNNRERLALGSSSSSEVVFEFKVPADAIPGTYNYLIVVDAPDHYPEDTPMRHPGRLQVLPQIESTVRVNDPTFTLQPATSSRSPALVQPAQSLPVSVMVYNRSDRVDRFRLTCPDLPESWFKIIYPQGLELPGLVIATDGLDLNPGTTGEIMLLLTPPGDALAGTYFPSVRLYSTNNPDLVLLDVVYLEILPVYLLSVELRTIVSRVRNKEALFEVRLNNQGNTEREILLVAKNADDETLCDYTVNPDRLRVLPKSVVTSIVKVKPSKWWRRPLFGGGLQINFLIETEDTQHLPILNELPPGTVIWEPRPWWQFLLVILTTLGTIAAIIFLIWWFFFRPPTPPKIMEFSSEANIYEEGEFIRLNWQIKEPSQLEAIKITSQSPDGKVFTEPRLYNFSKGIPNELEGFCAIKPVLICKNVRTDARQAGDYVFELQIFSKRAKDVASESLKTQPIKISPIPLPKIIEFNSTKPVYEEVADFKVQDVKNKSSAPNTDTASATLPPKLLDAISLNWKIIKPDQLKELKIIGRSPDGVVNSKLKTYDFSQGIPKELENLCKKSEKEELICTNVVTDARQAGDYIFELTVVSKQGQGEPSDSKKTDTIKIKAQPVEPKIVYFKINNKDALPKYLLPINKKSLSLLIISWKVEGDKDIKVELLPSPGTVPTVGSIPYPLSQQPNQETITLKVTTGSGKQIERSVTLELFEPAPPISPSSMPTLGPTPPKESPKESPTLSPALVVPPPPGVIPPTPGVSSGSQPPSPGGSSSPSPGGGSPSPSPSGGSPSPADPNSPSPSNPGSLSPSELPPRAD